MRSPSRDRPKPKALASNVPPQELHELAAGVRYVGSPEHKTYPSFAGQPVLRSDATPCPTAMNDASRILGWLREAIIAGQVSAYRDQGLYPRYVWDRREDTWFEARLTNATLGHYKGYPVTADSVPASLRREIE